MRRNMQIISFWILGILLGNSTMMPAAPVGTAITYQGRLTDGGTPATAKYDFRFTLYDALTGGSQVGLTNVETGIDVEDGYFTVDLSFGGVFQGDARWLEIRVAPYLSGSYTLLTPRQELTPTPYALYAASSGADSDWVITGNNMFSTVSGNVGIGTGSPFAPLHVFKSVDSTAKAALRVSTGEMSGELTVSYDLLFDRCSIDSSVSPFGTTPSLQLNPSSTGDVLLGGGGGNIGIGTSTPSEKLEVSGTAKVETVNDQYGIKLVNQGGFSGISYGIHAQATSTDNQDYNGIYGSATGGTGSNTGVYGYAAGSGYKNGVIANATGTGTNYALYAIASGGTTNWAGYFNGDVYANGKVGIGTTTPQAKLEVSGGQTILEQESWQTPTFQNGWSNYGVGFNPTQYFIDSTGVVHLRGLATGGTIGQPIFTLPAGYRPEFREMHTAMTNPNVAARVDIYSNGEVVAETGNSFFVSLDGITFRADN